MANIIKKPLISVIMPVYNGEAFIKEAIDSVLSQTYRNFELIIINNKSTDKTRKIIEDYKKKNPYKIKIIHFKKPLGAFGAANKGLKIAKGKFIAPMDSDDISHPKRFEKQIEFLLSHPENILVGTQANIIDQFNKEIGKKIFPISHRKIYASFFDVNPIVHPSCMIRRSLLPNRSRLYANKYGANDDYFTLFTLLKYGEFSNLPEILFSYRIHSGNSSLQNLRQKFFTTVRIRFKVLRLGYKPTILGFIKFSSQIILVSLMPEKILFPVFLLVKRIYTPKKFIFSLFNFSFPGIHSAFFRLKKIH